MIKNGWNWSEMTKNGQKGRRKFRNVARSQDKPKLVIIGQNDQWVKWSKLSKSGLK